MNTPHLEESGQYKPIGLVWPIGPINATTARLAHHTAARELANRTDL